MAGPNRFRSCNSEAGERHKRGLYIHAVCNINRSIDIKTAPQLRQIIYATSNFRYLRGLTMLPVSLLMVVFPILGHLSESHRNLAFAGLLAGLVMAALATKLIYNFYDRRFGKVESSETGWFPGLAMALWTAIFLMCIISDGRHPGLSLAALWVAAYFWGIYMTSAGHRWYYLVLTACFALLVPRWGEIGESWQSALMGAGLAVGGLMDHLVLTRFLSTAAEDHGSSVLL